MNSSTIKHISMFLLLFTMSVHAERAYTVERVIIPEYHITMHNTVYTLMSSETQIFDSQWNNKKKFSFSYDREGMQGGYSIVNWSDSLECWTDSMYCMFFYNSRKQPIAYHVSPVHDDTVDNVLYKEYYFYDNTTSKLEKMTSFSQNSTDSLVLSSEEEYIYSQNSELDSVTTTNYDEDDNYIWSIVTEKVRYTSDTVYSIFENTSYIPYPDSPAITFDVEHQYLFSSDGKKRMQGKCLVAGVLTERTLYSDREEDGLPEMDLSQNIDSFTDKTYKDTSRISYTYSFQDKLITKTATTEILASENWIPVSKKIDTYSSEEVSVRKNSLMPTDRHYKINAYLPHSSHPALFISSSERITSIELFSISGALLHKEKTVHHEDKIRLDLSTQKAAYYCGPMVAKIQLENGFTSTQRIFQVR